MKKSIYLISFVLIMALLFSGCQKDQESDDTNALPDPSEMIVDPGIDTDGKIDSSLISFENQLGESGLTLEDKAVKDAVSIGALEGYSFNINGKPVEIYLFDGNSSDEKAVENLKTAKESGYVTIFGVEVNGETPKVNCAIKDNLVILFILEDILGVYPDKEKIIEAFMKI
ncbi:hypothetical protein [Fusibacter bizertensis]